MNVKLFYLCKACSRLTAVSLYPQHLGLGREGIQGCLVYRWVGQSVTLGFVRSSVVNCLTGNPAVLGLSRIWIFFIEVPLGKTLQSPRVKPREDMNNVSCCYDKIEILMKAA